MTAFVVGVVVGAGMVAASWVASAWVEHVATVRGAAEDEEKLEAWRRLKTEEVANDEEVLTWRGPTNVYVEGLQVEPGPADDQDDTVEQEGRV